MKFSLAFPTALLFTPLALWLAAPGVAMAAPPSVTLTNPPLNTALSEGDSIFLQADASDTDGTVTKVEFYCNGSLVEEDGASPFAVTWSPLVAGNYDLFAVAVDEALERATSAVVTVAVSIPGLRTLTPAYPGAPMDWNMTSVNWKTGGAFTVFRPGDSVIFSNTAPVFIGSAGTSGTVSPASVVVSRGQLFDGGDILTGSLLFNGNPYFGGVTFSNLTGSLSFPGGTTILRANSLSGKLVYDVSTFSDSPTVHLGTGPITLNGSDFSFRLRTNQSATLLNDFDITGTGCSISAGAGIRTNASTRFTGMMNLSTGVSFSTGSGIGGVGMLNPDNFPLEWAGPVVLDQSATRTLEIEVGGNYERKGLLLSGNISDGPGPASNSLSFENYAAPYLRLTGTNTYSKGTLIRSSPSAPKGPVEVGPNSSLGTGPVKVDSGGVLHMFNGSRLNGDVTVFVYGVLRVMGNSFVASNANWAVGGLVILDPGTKIRVKTLNLGGVTRYSGLFTQTNGGGYLSSNGTIRVPAINALPTISLTSPPNGTIIPAGGAINFAANASDTDSYLDRVEFYAAGMLAGVKSNTPFQLSFTNPPGGRYPVFAVACDDEGARRTSIVNQVTVPPRITRINHLGDNTNVVVFDGPLNRGGYLQKTDSLMPPAWEDLTQFPSSSVPRVLSITNAVPPGTNTVFYRLRMF